MKSSSAEINKLIKKYNKLINDDECSISPNDLNKIIYESSFNHIIKMFNSVLLINILLFKQKYRKELSISKFEPNALLPTFDIQYIPGNLELDNILHTEMLTSIINILFWNVEADIIKPKNQMHWDYFCMIAFPSYFNYFVDEERCASAYELIKLSSSIDYIFVDLIVTFILNSYIFINEFHEHFFSYITQKSFANENKLDFYMKSVFKAMKKSIIKLWKYQILLMKYYIYNLSLNQNEINSEHEWRCFKLLKKIIIPMVSIISGFDSIDNSFIDYLNGCFNCKYSSFKYQKEIKKFIKVLFSYKENECISNFKSKENKLVYVPITKTSLDILKTYTDILEEIKTNKTLDLNKNIIFERSNLFSIVFMESEICKQVYFENTDEINEYKDVISEWKDIKSECDYFGIDKFDKLLSMNNTNFIIKAYKFEIYELEKVKKLSRFYQEQMFCFKHVNKIIETCQKLSTYILLNMSKFCGKSLISKKIEDDLALLLYVFIEKCSKLHISEEKLKKLIDIFEQKAKKKFYTFVLEPEKFLKNLCKLENETIGKEFVIKVIEKLSIIYEYENYLQFIKVYSINHLVNNFTKEKSIKIQKININEKINYELSN